ncbi:heme ABC exporter ATP-binding protein CcmA [Sphingomonas psychrotolerans]|uniref:Heme ABC exporter ATP-binding protein CcmA n=1 Tax=Sphingomonas psychrotolerans TaxID=1327635 RepID=A0A2K8MHB8_9SPHN|nr:heme ABC exporter ATP-binding protein CcmA [Sphingomonas psychrotolerans]ATY33280.1 heme ABC exporter ATP-binding protein CcmA [Sphingomonas psychrotolerans]
MSAGLAFADVACVRGGRLLFEGLRFALGPGDAALVTGPNGTGKSSLIRIAAGLLPAAAGRVTGKGARALLAETAALDPELALAAALRFWARIDGRAMAVEAALAAVDLEQLAQVPVRLLSTGQRRRAAFARILASGAPVWLLDEPANGLDTQSAQVLEQLIADHRGCGGIALVATHLPIALPHAQEVRL